MWYQKDWFTGSDYYNLKEKQIHAESNERGRFLLPLHASFL